MTTLSTVEEVADVIATAGASASRTIVGIVGPPGAGKSTVAALVVERLGPIATLLPMDGFHLPQARLVELGRRERMGAPDTFDVPGFLRVLTALAGWESGASSDGGTATGAPADRVLAPGFDRTIEEAVPDAIAIDAATPIVVVEGNYLLLDTDGWEYVAPHLDVTFYVDVDPAIRQQRLIERHVRYGKTPDAALEWSLGPDEANARLIEGTAASADHVIRLLH
ncbi:nucleoside/nucleotide kinase family protein [Glaciihabitans sp. dw_435]|uniref:nucleoside/nucleotide kinase family protein n=1 Tax=Glaciihabitans sp. dw_435 TaxID=2720081 RepID=UPI001BD4EBC6|nr:nucleoside/nucleotide kinase family protein [Glaciihabitans sp. dw_435]